MFPSDDDLRRAAGELAAEAGLGPVTGVHRLRGGRNNRVYRLETAARTVLLKSYFVSDDDPRDRLAAEFAFATFAWKHGVRGLPEPIAADPLWHLALYAFIDGTRPAEVDAARLAEAVAFFTAINRYRTAPDASPLPFASEACFSIEDHLSTVDARVRRVQRLAGADADGGALRPFVEDLLRPAWQRVRERTHLAVRAANIAGGAVLPGSGRCLSPSDFGFHNALVAADGALRFHDFEYAGWDDPAKLVCDFFCQVDVPVPMHHWEYFSSAVTSALSLPAGERVRMDLLLPAYRIKWCCIVLNEFLPEAAQRRAFARADEIPGYRRAQLDKARTILETVD